jgi:hypothetical protein
MGSSTRQQKKPRKKLKNSNSSSKQSESKPPSISPAWAFGLSELDILTTLDHILNNKYTVHSEEFTDYFKVLHQSTTLTNKEYSLYFVAVLVSDSSNLYPGSLLWEFYVDKLNGFLSKLSSAEYRATVNSITDRCAQRGVVLNSVG